ncbi:hypothetical protein BHYA_0035g00010 [Botrytis hyacinthi]|uniref:Transcription factor CBF/NF-Y/archaeal histone domain-containing protein n=1 Tax=Botrytis hyacinthi TaxID=278943 RepID=A0A4Z1H5N7_9HELO|nr:hypothetical protein BHYA_0035g00010 [Botrytis hyacinthi]
MDSTYTPQSPDLSGFLPPDANPNKHQPSFHPLITSSGTSSLSSYAPRSPGIPHFGNGTIGTPTSTTTSRLSQPIQHLNYHPSQSNQSDQSDQSDQSQHLRFTANHPGNVMNEFPDYNTFHTTNQYMPPIPALPPTHSFGSQGTNLTTIGTTGTTATTATTATTPTTAPQFYYPSHSHSHSHSHSDSLPHSHSQTIKSDLVNINNNSPIITSSSTASSHSQSQPQPQPHSQYLDQFQNTEATLSVQSPYDHRIPSPFTLGNDPVEIYQYNNNPQNPLYHESYTNQLETTTRQPRQSRVKSQPITTASFNQSHTPQYQPKMSFAIAPQPPAALPSNKNPNPDGIEIRTKFPVARIKRIMQADEEVGKVAQVTPVAVSKALELFMISLVQGAAKVAREKGGKRVTAGCLKRVVEENDQFDFLSEIVGRVQEVVPAAKEEKDGEGKKRKASAAKKEEGSESEVEPEVDAGEPKKKGRGKGKGGRKKKVEVES